MPIPSRHGPLRTPQKMRWMLPTVALLTTLVALPSACGGDDGGATSGSDTTSSGAGGTTSSGAGGTAGGGAGGAAGGGAGGTDDTVAPVITLLGSSSVALAVGDTYVDAGATASDDVDGDISSHIVTVSTVDTTAVGNYSVSYDVTDASGNAAAQVVRSVVVSPPPHVYGTVGGHALAPPWQEPNQGMSVIYRPADYATIPPTPVVFFAPGWTSVDPTDYQSLLTFTASQGYSIIFAKDNSGAYSANHLIGYFNTMATRPEVAPYIDTTKIGVIGHSSGGGHAFKTLAALSAQGWGASARFLFSMEPWFAFDMNNSDMQMLPANTHAIVIQFGPGGNNNVNNTDARIPLTEFYLLTSIPAAEKDYQIFVNADHNYPKGNGSYASMAGILKPLDALMDYTFNASAGANAHQVALEVGNDDPYANGNGIQVVKPMSAYQYRCDGNDNSGANATLANSDIDYCAGY